MLVFSAIRKMMVRMHLQRMASLCWSSRSVQLQLFFEPPSFSKALVSCKFIHQEQSILGRRGSSPEHRFVSTHSTGLPGIGPIPPLYSAHLWVACGVRNFTIKENGDHKEVSIPKEGPEVEKSQHKKVLEGGAKYSVLRINSDGAMSSLTLKSSELGIHPRDVDLLASAKSFVPQRASISVRNEKIVVRMENVRALVTKNHLLLFEARRPRIGKVSAFSAGVTSDEAILKARELFATSLAQQAKEPPGYPYDFMPFHLRMLECLLEETSNFFHQKVERLKVVVERMLEELTKDVNMGGLQRLLPLKRALTEVEHDVRDAHNAMDQVLNSDDILQDLCFEGDIAMPVTADPTSTEEEAPQQTNLRQATADMLLTYQREVDDSGGALEELRKDMDAAQEIWELGLDTTRNRIIRTDLIMSMGTLSLSVAAVVASFFGMNLQSGFEEHPTLFWWVVGGATATSLSLSSVLIFIFRVWPKIADKRRAQDLAGLHDILQHLDDIDDIFQVVVKEVAGKAVTQEEFYRIVRMHPSARFMRQRELDLMFRLFDVNRNRLLEMRECNFQNNGLQRNRNTPQTA